MLVAIDASPLFRRRGGIGWYTYHLVKHLIRIDQDNEYLLYTTALSDKGETVTTGLNRNVRVIRVSKVLMGWRSRWDRIDLYHGTNYKVPAGGCYRRVVTIHDMALDRFPQFSRKLFGQRWASSRTCEVARRADMVIAVSQHTANDIQEYYGIPPERIAVIYNGVDEEYFPERDPVKFGVLQERYGIRTDRYILYVGGSDPRKNLHTLLQAYHRLPAIHRDYGLVVVGGIGWGSQELYDCIGSLKLQNSVVLAGYVPVVDLRILYSMAAVLVYPSLYEGFGLPPLEAMACGCPVITSNSSSLPEVVGEVAPMLDPLDVEGLASAIERVVCDGHYRELLRVKGFERAKLFSWEKTARETLAIYRHVSAKAE